MNQYVYIRSKLSLWYVRYVLHMVKTTIIIPLIDVQYAYNYSKFSPNSCGYQTHTYVTLVASCMCTCTCTCLGLKHL